METQDDLELLRRFYRCSHALHKTQKYRGQSRLLILLLERGTLTQRELITITDRRSATLSQQLESMEQAGYVIRKINDNDKRNLDIELTAAGKSAAQEAQTERRELARRIFKDLSADERRQFAQLLDHIIAQLG